MKKKDKIADLEIWQIYIGIYVYSIIFFIIKLFLLNGVVGAGVVLDAVAIKKYQCKR